MKKTGNRGRVNQALHRFHQRHGEAINLVASGFGIVSGRVWMYGFLPAAPVWAWPAATGLAVLAAVLALYRAQEIEISQRDLEEANKRLVAITGDLLIRGVEQFARDAEARQQIPITETAGLLQTLRLIQQDLAGGVDPDLEKALSALAQYERQVTSQRQH